MDGSKQGELYILSTPFASQETICLLSPRSKQLCPSLPLHTSLSRSLSNTGVKEKSGASNKKLELSISPGKKIKGAPRSGATAATTTAEATPVGLIPRGSCWP
ncbi:hypothetical protein HU200_046973 [Digitaria exilis]|uniref:Uncharacterized protein n=1 Tax=Digitaria exilis TaxID=1010633 RepID=A0A835E8Y1_9POAL|nr:hypothetical protein HU200_046973 [Digitaria exilis]